MNEENIYAPPTGKITDGTQSAHLKPYAAFWQRLLALIIDIIALSLLGLVLAGVMLAVKYMTGLSETASFIIETSVGLLLGWLYYALMESSSTQGTLGKLALDIRVSDLKGDRISFARATGRHFGTYLSALILGIGYFIQPFTEKKQTLHDLMSGCVLKIK